MANEQNLTHKLTASDQRKGGKASGKARREKANLKKCLEILLEKETENKSGEKVSGAEALSAKLFQTAMKGDVKAFEVLRDTAGQKPVEKVENTNTDVVIDFGDIPKGDI